MASDCEGYNCSAERRAIAESVSTQGLRGNDRRERLAQERTLTLVHSLLCAHNTQQMPLAPPRPCTGAPACPNYQGQCPTHPTRAAWRGTTPPPPRIRGQKLQKLRLELWEKDPHCQMCRRLLAPRDMVRDHIVNLADRGADTQENSQILCKPCHREKTTREAQRGVARNRF